MRKTITILIAILIGCGVNCFAQGKVTRSTKQATTSTSKPKKSTPKVNVSEPDGYINGHGYVDLGLPSGTKWATCNVGATTPTGYGGLYAWGETKTKTLYNGENSLTWEKSHEYLKSNGIIDKDGNLTCNHDAVSVNWGSQWRMPAKEDFTELVKECRWDYISENGKYGYGYKVTGPSGKSIFLPTAGNQGAYDKQRNNKIHWGTYGGYWSSSPSLKRVLVSGPSGEEWQDLNSVYLHIGPGEDYGINAGVRLCGMSVRGVTK